MKRQLSITQNNNLYKISDCDQILPERVSFPILPGAPFHITKTFLTVAAYPNHQPRRKKEKMLDTVTQEYKRRGKPLAHTGWGPEEVRAYMVEYMKKVQPGGDIGAYSRQLPKKISSTQPAPLPDWVKKRKKKGCEEDEEEATESGDSGSEAEDDDGVGDEGWIVVKKKQKYYLTHKPTKETVELGSPEEDSVWEVRNDKDEEMDYLWQDGNDDFDEIPCRDFFNEVKAPEKPKDLRSDKPEPLKGMKPKQGAETGKQKGKVKQEHDNKKDTQEEEFGADSSEEEAEASKTDEKDSKPAPFVDTDGSGKMYLIFPVESKELKLPVDTCQDWEVTTEGTGPETRHWLKSKSGKGKSRDCEVLMAGRKVKDITDESRLLKVKAAQERQTKKGMTDSEAEEGGVEPEWKITLRQSIEKEMREDLEKRKAEEKALKEQREKELRERLENERVAQEKAATISQKEKDAARQREKAAADEKRKQEDKARMKEEELAKEEEQRLRKKIEDEMREELRQKLAKEAAEKEAAEKAKDAEKKEMDEKKDEKTKDEPKDEKPKSEKQKDEKAKKEEKDEKDGKGEKPKGEAAGPFAKYGGVAKWMDAEVKEMRKRDREKFWDRVKKREAKEAKVKAKTTALQDPGLRAELPQVNLDE